MKARIVQEVAAFLETSGVTGIRLSREALVPLPTISRLKNGKRGDVCSRHADALREAMARLAAEMAASSPASAPSPAAPLPGSSDGAPDKDKGK